MFDGVINIFSILYTTRGETSILISLQVFFFYFVCKFVCNITVAYIVALILFFLFFLPFILIVQKFNNLIFCKNLTFNSIESLEV
jgi:hypothetical protein